MNLKRFNFRKRFMARFGFGSIHIYAANPTAYKKALHDTLNAIRREYDKERKKDDAKHSK